MTAVHPMALRQTRSARTADDDFSAIETLYGIGYRYNEE